MNTSRKSLLTKCMRSMFALTSAGMVFSSSCSAGEVKAILDGVEVAAAGIAQEDQSNVSFTDWLSAHIENH